MPCDICRGEDQRSEQGLFSSWGVRVTLKLRFPTPYGSLTSLCPCIIYSAKISLRTPARRQGCCHRRLLAEHATNPGPPWSDLRRVGEAPRPCTVCGLARAGRPPPKSSEDTSIVPAESDSGLGLVSSFGFHPWISNGYPK